MESVEERVPDALRELVEVRDGVEDAEFEPDLLGEEETVFVTVTLSDELPEKELVLDPENESVAVFVFVTESVGVGLEELDLVKDNDFEKVAVGERLTEVD